MVNIHKGLVVPILSLSLWGFCCPSCVPANNGKFVSGISIYLDDLFISGPIYTKKECLHNLLKVLEANLRLKKKCSFFFAAVFSFWVM